MHLTISQILGVHFKVMTLMSLFKKLTLNIPRTGTSEFLDGKVFHKYSAGMNENILTLKFNPGKFRG